MERRIVIIGGPHVGKTTLAKRLKDECGITNTHHSDDVKHLGWSESSAAVSEWFNEAGEWVVEGVQAARALRKWLIANPTAKLDADVVILDKPFGPPLLPGQASMTKGVHTVFGEIEKALIERGVRVHKLKDPKDAINLFSGSTNPAGERKTTVGEQMLKIYDKLEDVPEALREHYKLVGGKYVPDLSDDHPVLVNNKTLLNEKTAAETKASGLETQVATLKADLESAKASGLPRGHKAVPTADAEFLEKVKAHGTADEIAAKLTEHKTLKEEGESRKQQDHLRAVAKTLEYDEEAFLLLPKLVSQFPEMEIRDSDGKKVVIAKVKDDKGVITEKPATEFIGATPEFSKVALKASGTGTRVPEQRSGSTATGSTADDLITQRNKQREDARKTAPNPLMAKAVLPGAQATQ